MPSIEPRRPATRPSTPAPRKPAGRATRPVAAKPDEPGVSKAPHRAGPGNARDRISTRPRAKAPTHTISASKADAEARREYALGKLAFETGRLDHALKHFERGYELSKRPGFLFNIGQTLWSLGKLRRAAHVLKIYRAKAPAAQRPKIDGILAQIARSRP